MQRRQFLTRLAGLCGGALMPRLVRAQGMAMDHGMGMNLPGRQAQAVELAPVEAIPAGMPLNAIPRLFNESGQAGLFRGTLTAAPASISLIPGKTTTVWAYNASLPAPLIEVMEGDAVEIALHNRLPQPTTIHWHGLPVPPDQDGNPHDAVPAGETRVYRFTLPKGSAGTYWYHPHPHGDTPEQVFRGLAGPFIVRAADDPLHALPERLLVFTDLKLDAQGAIPNNDMNDWMNGREGQFVLVNGQRLPTLTLHPGGRERWRLVNACSARHLRLTLLEHAFTLVGTDGGLIERPQPGLREWLLAPAQRAEIVVTAGAGASAQLVAAPYRRGKMGMVAPEKTMPLLTVVFGAGQATAAALPERLRTITDFSPVKAKKRVVLSEVMSMGSGQHSMKFLINGNRFGMRRVDLVSKLGEVEEWEIVNDADMDHPFHLHGTQFVVIERKYQGKVSKEPFRAYQDTVQLRAQETVRIRCVQHFRGLRMFHCHILEHEGQGMMGTLRVV